MLIIQRQEDEHKWRITVKTGDKISCFPMIMEVECDRAAAYQAAVNQFGADRVIEVRL